MSPANYFTTATNSFSDPDWRAKQRRLDAINALRKSASPIATVAKERAFKAGQKSSTFPWANSATAVIEQFGPCWLASEIAVIGAASPLNLGYTKHPGKTAFGSKAHPAELLAQTRQNAGDATWWTEQLKTAADDTAKAEWALGAWAVASGTAIDSLFSEWEQTVQDLGDERRAVLLRSAAQIAGYGWLRKRRITATSSDPVIAPLLELRAPADTRAGRPAQREGGAAPAMTEQASLLSAARSAKWLKVDAVSVYK